MSEDTVTIEQDEKLKKQRAKNLEAVHRYRKNHPDRLAASTKAWRLRNLEKVREIGRRHHYKHREKRNAYTRQYLGRRKKELQETLQAIKAEATCVDCGQSYPYYVMDFDHVRGKKRFNMGQVSALLPGKQALLDELNKCEVVCANCHRERTHGKAH